MFYTSSMRFFEVLELDIYHYFCLKLALQNEIAGFFFFYRHFYRHLTQRFQILVLLVLSDRFLIGSPT